MARSIFITATNNNAVNNDTTTYTHICSNLRYFTTEADAERTFRTAGVFSNLYVKVGFNNQTGASTVTLRKNRGNGNLTLSIGASSTGEFSDTTHVDTCAVADEFDYQLITPTGTSKQLTVVVYCVQFNPDDRSLTLSSLTNFGSFSTSGTTINYLLIGGNLNTAAAEAGVAIDVNVAGTLKNLYVYIQSNTKAGAVVYRSRKNTANGNLVVSVGAGLSGAFEDTANSDTIAANDDIAFQLDRSASGAGTIVMLQVSAELLSSNNEFTLHTGLVSGKTENFATTEYMALSGEIWMYNEGWFRANANDKILYSNITINVTTNSVNDASTFTLRKDGAATSLSASITASTTGIFEDASNSVLCHEGSEVCVEIATGGSSGSLFFRITGIKGTVYELKDVIGSGNLIPTSR